MSVRDKAVQTWQGMIFKIWKNSTDRQFEQEAAVSGSYQVAPSASTDGQFGQFGGKRAEATTTGAGSGKRQKSRHVATIAPLPRLLAIIGRAVVARDIDWLHFTPNINIWELFDLPKCENSPPIV